MRVNSLPGLVRRELPQRVSRQRVPVTRWKSTVGRLRGGEIKTMRKCFICRKHYEGGRELTCSDECHQELVRRLITEFGEFKKVVRASTGVAYKVPTKDIIETGLKEQDLDQYPLWEEQGWKLLLPFRASSYPKRNCEP